MAKQEVMTQNRCPVHGMYPATSTMVACPKCASERVAVSGKRGGKLALQAVRVRAIIRRGKQTFIEVGDALMAMRDQKLYRQFGYETFQDFCDAEGLSRSYAYRQISASKMARNVAIGDKPTSEAQARELASVLKSEGEEAVREVMAAAGSKPTAAKIRRAIKERNQPLLEPTYEIEQPCGHYYVCSKCGNVQP